MDTSTAPASPAARATWKNHGRPSTGYYFGDGKTPTGAGRAVTVRAVGSVEIFDAASGERIAEHSTRSMWWYASAAEVTTEDLERARLDAAHTEARHIAEVRRLTSDRVDPTDGLLYSCLAVDQIRAAQAGRGPLAVALAERVAALRPAYEAEETERARLVAEQKARIIALRAAPGGVYAVVEPSPAEQPEVVIVPCGGRKLDHAAPAGEIYTGSYHAACRRAAAARGGRLFILSALHGLLDPATVIEPYDLRMGQPGSVTARQVRDQAGALGILGARVTVLAGRAYADVVRAVWPDADRPLHGTRGIGDQLAALATIATMPRPVPRRRPAPAPRRRPRRAVPVIAGQLALFAA